MHLSPPDILDDHALTDLSVTNSPGQTGKIRDWFAIQADDNIADPQPCRVGSGTRDHIPLIG